MRRTAVLLAAAGLLIVVGVALLSVPFAFITGGVLLAGWTLLIVLEVPDGESASAVGDTQA